jgi:hypothetical protein
LGAEWGEDRRAVGREHRKAYEKGEAVHTNPLGQPWCRLCGGRIEGPLVSVGGTTTGSKFYHEWCYDDRWSHIMERLR